MWVAAPHVPHSWLVFPKTRKKRENGEERRVKRALGRHLPETPETLNTLTLRCTAQTDAQREQCRPSHTRPHSKKLLTRKEPRTELRPDHPWRENGGRMSSTRWCCFRCGVCVYHAKFSKVVQFRFRKVRLLGVSYKHRRRGPREGTSTALHTHNFKAA